MKKGFTLLELLITLGALIAILVVTAATLNPREQLARSRDSQRVKDLDALVAAWNTYIAEAGTNATLDANGRCVDDGQNSTYYMSRSKSIEPLPPNFANVIANANQSLGENGWAPARIDEVRFKTELAELPLDPLGSETEKNYWYAYACDQKNGTYEFTARFESKYFKDGVDFDGNDGGNSPYSYEIGNDPHLDLIPSGY